LIILIIIGQEYKLWRSSSWAGFCEQGKEPSGSIYFEEYLNWPTLPSEVFFFIQIVVTLEF
jgi:hypothetical protein